MLRARGAFTVAYRLSNLKATIERNGNVVVTGRVGRCRPQRGVPPVVLYTYQLRGRVLNAAGEPVRGAVVVTRTLDRDFWTMSTPTDASGRYTSFFAASDRSEANPVGMNVQVAVGNTSYVFPAARPVRFQRLRSAELDIRLPASGTTITTPDTTSYPGAVYQGMLVGVSGRNGVIRPAAGAVAGPTGPLHARPPALGPGPDAPASGRTRARSSRGPPAAPGRNVDLQSWPSGLTQRVPQNLGSLRVPRR